MSDDILNSSNDNAVNGMGEAVASCFKKFATFKGRAGRPEFWWFFLFVLIVGIVLVVIDILIFGVDGAAWLSNLWFLGTTIPSISVGARRLHDTNRSAWWILLILIPLIGAIAFWILCALKGTEGENRFG